MIVYTRADYKAMGYADGSNPRTEIVVLHARKGSSERDSSRGACLDDPAIGITLRAGYDGQLACRCVPHPRSGQRPQITNCDATTAEDTLAAEPPAQQQAAQALSPPAPCSVGAG